MTAFKLEKRHLENGLTEEDFSQYAGYPVTCLYLDDFPHWDKIRANTPLSSEEMRERVEAIVNALPKGNSSQDVYTTAENAAKAQGHWIITDTICQKIKLQKTYNHHFRTIQEQGVDTVIDSPALHYRSSPDAWMSNYIVPAVLNEPIQATEFSKGYIATACLVRQEKDTAQTRWATSLKLPTNCSSHFPTDNLDTLLSDLHEMRHTPQVLLHPLNVTINYYKELDADLFARSVLRQAGIGHETLQANMHERYLQILTMLQRYSFAPTLEALEAGQTPPTFQEVHEASMYMQYRLIQALSPSLAKVSSYKAAQYAQKCWENRAQDTNWINDSNFLTEQMSWVWTTLPPQTIFTCLHTLTEENAFTHPLTAHIASRIIAAAKYFGGTNLIHTPALSTNRFSNQFHKPRHNL